MEGPPIEVKIMGKQLPTDASEARKIHIFLPPQKMPYNYHATPIYVYGHVIILIYSSSAHINLLKTGTLSRA